MLNRIAGRVPQFQHVPDASLVGIQTGQESRPRGAASRRIVELEKPRSSARMIRMFGLRFGASAFVTAPRSATVMAITTATDAAQVRVFCLTLIGMA